MPRQPADSACCLLGDGSIAATRSLHGGGLSRCPHSGHRELAYVAYLAGAAGVMAGMAHLFPARQRLSRTAYEGGRLLSWKLNARGFPRHKGRRVAAIMKAVTRPSVAAGGNEPPGARLQINARRNSSGRQRQGGGPACHGHLPGGHVPIINMQYTEHATSRIPPSVLPLGCSAGL